MRDCNNYIKIYFLKLNILDIRYLLVTIYKDLLDSHKKIYIVDKKKHVLNLY